MTDSLIVNNNYKDLLVNVVDASTGELAETDLMKLDEIDCKPAEKTNAIAQVFKLFEVDEKQVEDKIKAMQMELMDFRRKKEAVRNLMAESMAENGLKKMETIYFAATFKKNPPRLVIEEGANVDQYTRIETVESVDKIAIKQDLKAGKPVEGCRLEQTERLEIK